MGTSDTARIRARLLFAYLQSGPGRTTTEERRSQLAELLVESSVGRFITNAEQLHLLRQTLDQLERGDAFDGVGAPRKTGVRAAPSKRTRKHA